MTVVNSLQHNLDMQDWTYRGLAVSRLHIANSSPTEVSFMSDLNPYMFAAPDFELLNAWLKITGSGFGDFDVSGIPHSGTVTNAIISDPTGPVLSLSQLALPVTQLLAAIGSNDPALLRSVRLGGDDLIDGGSQPVQKVGGPLFESGDAFIGGPGDDTISGHGGVNDTLVGGAGDDLIAPEDAQHLSNA